VTVALGGSGAGVVAGVPDGIACPEDCGQDYLEGSTVLLAALPAPGSVFAGWSGSCSGKRACVLELNRDAFVSADFRVERHTLDISVGGSGFGLVSDPAAGIHCGQSCSNVYDGVTLVMLVADPARGSAFAGWRNCPQPSGSRCVAPLRQDLSLGAKFVKSPRLELGQAFFRGATAVLDAEVSSPGDLEVAGDGIEDFAKHVSGRTPVALHIALDRKRRRTLTREGRVSVHVTVTFRPSDGGAPLAVTRMLTYNTKEGGR
jgi:hypothetical protein